jgi:hypothetical protein
MDTLLRQATCIMLGYVDALAYTATVPFQVYSACLDATILRNRQRRSDYPQPAVAFN